LVGPTRDDPSPDHAAFPWRCPAVLRQPAPRRLPARHLEPSRRRGPPLSRDASAPATGLRSPRGRRPL